MELSINTVLHNKYRIISILGSGGFGITYLAEHELLGQKVAIKEFFMDGCVRTDAGDISYQSTKVDLFVDFKARFKTEAQTLAKFKHPSIVRVTDIFEENGTSYFVMDCIEGQTLKEWVQQHGAMPVKTAVNYLKQIIGALEEVHTKDMLHRDIKPDNIMISNKGTAVLIDFGAARDFISVATKSNTGIHTPGYAPIEQYGSGKLDARTDIYGLCATFYFALTGKKPVDAISRFPDDSLASLSQIDSYIPEWLSLLIMKGLSPDMKNRFSSVVEMNRAMEKEKILPINADKTTINQSNKTEIVRDEKTQFNTIDKTTIHQTDKTEFVKEEKTQFIKEKETEIINEPKVQHSNSQNNFTSQKLVEKQKNNQVLKQVLKVLLLIFITVGGLLWYASRTSSTTEYEETPATEVVAEPATEVVAEPVAEAAAEAAPAEAAPLAEAAPAHYDYSEQVADIDGNVYKTVKIGNQTWMAENLKTTKYNDGTEIPLVTDNSVWENLPNTESPGYCYYDNNSSNKYKYGALYNWYVVDTDKLCPVGWHVPSDAEWTTLTTYLGGESVAGGKLKATATSNSSGFTALLGGNRHSDGEYSDILGSSGSWWSTSVYDNNNYYHYGRSLYYSRVDVNRVGIPIGGGESVRCIRD